MATTFDLLGICEESKTPGTSITIYRTRASWISIYPSTKKVFKLAQTPPLEVSQGDSVILEGDIILDSATPGIGYWQTFNIRINSGKTNFNMIGEQGGSAFTSGFAFQIEGNKAAQVEFAIQSAQPCWIYAVKKKNGTMEILGNPDSPAYAESIEGDGGSKAGDFVGISHALKCDASPVFYEGVIDLTPNP